MDRVLQAQENAQNSFQEYIQPLQVRGLLLYFSGTNDTGQTGDNDDLGSVIIKRFGETLVNRKISTLADMGDINAGSNLFSSTTAGAFVSTVFIPFYLLSFPNALNIEGASELNFEYQPGANQATVFSALTLSVYAEESFNREEYEVFILGDDQTPASAVTSRPYQLNRDNIGEIFVKDVTGSPVLTSLALRQNGEQRFSDQPLNVYKAGTLYNNQLETATTDMIKLMTHTFGQPNSLRNSKSVLEFTTSATGTIEVTTVSIRPRGNKTQNAGR